MKKYCVIGGQYDPYCYGFSDSLTGAKQMATKNVEHWDNWQGWHYPCVYRSEDVEPYHAYDAQHYRPKDCAKPVARRVYGGNWEML